MSKRLTQEEFVAKIKRIYGDKYTVVGKYVNWCTPVKIQCNNCKYVFPKIPNGMDSGVTCCPKCESKKNTLSVIVGVNDMWTTDKDVASLLENPNDGYKYRANSNKLLNFKCPQCGQIKREAPNKVKRFGCFSCKYCSDGISYPNRLMANLLNILNIEFIPEYHIDNYSYRYDFFFVLNDNKYLIEMDGAYGHGECKTMSRTIEEQIFIDKEKDMIAKENQYELIRIDCKYKDGNRFEYISNNILSSQLIQLLQITKDDLKKADIKSQSSKIYKLANLWNSGVQSYDELFIELNTNCRNTIRRYMKKCIALHFVDDDYDSFLKKIRLSSNKKLSHSKGTKVKCIQTGEVFYSISEAQRQKHIHNLSSCILHNNGYCGKLPNGERMQWIKIA